MKALKILVIGGLAFLGGKYLFSLNRAKNKAVVQASGKVEKVTIEGVVVRLKFNIKNPTASNIEMAPPLIKMLYNNKVMASSSMALVEIPEKVKTDKGRIKILPYEETGEINVMMTLPFLSLIGTGANLVARLKDKIDPNAEQKPVEFAVETNSSIFTAVGSYPYDDLVKVMV